MELTLLYSVMQSDGNSFCGNVVLNGVCMAYRNEDSMLDKIRRSKYFRVIEENAYFKKYNKALIKLGLILVWIFV